MNAYGQFCPVAKACELLCERWTLLVVRELVCGSRRFNELRRGVPRMSPALLARRLRQLEHSGIVRRLAQGQRGSAYELTQAGQELRPLVESMGDWGHCWVRSDLRRRDLDVGLLMWDIRRSVQAGAALRPPRHESPMAAGRKATSSESPLPAGERVRVRGPLSIANSTLIELQVGRWKP
jgi:DNA-binding HxlR family transcriptional regulator